MGNYHNLESEFIERTINLITQYYEALDNYDFEEQYNFTLIINCLLGLIVMPKERVITYTPNPRLTRDLLAEIGIESSQFDKSIKTLRELIQALRHAVAHFDINVISEDERNLVDWVEFVDSQNGGALVARFRASELFPFLKYYAKCLLQNLERNRGK